MTTVKTLPGSGTISLNQIGAEFEDPAPINILGPATKVLRQLDSSLVGKPIKFSNFYGRSNTVFVNINSSRSNVNINSETDRQGKGHIRYVVVNFSGNITIGSSSTGSPSVQTGSFANNSSSAVMWINIGSGVRIFGRGGTGGNGGPSLNNNNNGTTGGNGGDAFWVNGAGLVRFNNSGIVAGGGGGGGGGSSSYACHKGNKSGCTGWDRFFGEGGFGGTGSPNGSNGVGNRAGLGGNGGIGGILGSPGGQGGTARTHSHGGQIGTPGNGGAAGFAVRRMSGTTLYDKVGDMRGTRQ